MSSDENERLRKQVAALEASVDALAVKVAGLIGRDTKAETENERLSQIAREDPFEDLWHEEEDRANALAAEAEALRTASKVWQRKYTEAEAERDVYAAKLERTVADIRNMAELYLWDEFADRAVNNGYGVLICYADELLAYPEGEQP